MATKSEVFANRRLFIMGLSVLVTVLFKAILLGLGPRFFRAGSPPTSEKSPLMLLVWLDVLMLDEIGMLFKGLYTLGRLEADDSGPVVAAYFM